MTTKHQRVRAQFQRAAEDARRIAAAATVTGSVMDDSVQAFPEWDVSTNADRSTMHRSLQPCAELAREDQPTVSDTHPPRAPKPSCQPTRVTGNAKIRRTTGKRNRSATKRSE
ncbi:hypothetical protein Arub01_46970 [Actinomadura rubrobrunea]|uniref:Uncharacterized protein n=1 Tax=Actinomadura rubrobrunea TaxID=115335 RepID=A0A9W6UXS8_9ACTN|nr:hypothetical protein [Actinomadura rubrobrunea]GLW66453.1 hypothetical protein Arub01_46970 [Actinomadura rubrobrunea]